MFEFIFGVIGWLAIGVGVTILLKFTWDEFGGNPFEFGGLDCFSIVGWPIFLFVVLLPTWFARLVVWSFRTVAATFIR